MVSARQKAIRNPQSILVVDNDENICDLLSTYLVDQGFRVATVADAGSMDEWLAQNKPDLVILDLVLPGEDGLSLARRLRNERDVPIIMISARNDEIDRIIGLEIGADDYLFIPFNPRELLARIHAVLRRTHRNHEPEETMGTDFIFGPFTLKTRQRCLYRQDSEINVSRAEYELLDVFVRNPGRVLSRDFIMGSLGGSERDPFDRSIDVRVTRLRHKIEPDPSHPSYIRTIWGAGYQFNPDVVTKSN